MLGYIALFVCVMFMFWIVSRHAGKSHQNRSGTIIVPMLFRGFLLGLLAGMLSGALIGSIGLYITENTGLPLGRWAIATGFFGAVLGALFGAAIGVLSSTLLGAITRRFFVPLKDPTFYSWVMIAVGMVSTVLLVLLVGWVLGRNSIQLNYDSAREMSDVILYILAPATFGGLLAIPYSLCLAHGYVSQSFQINSQSRN